MRYDRLLEGKKAFVSSAGAGLGRAIAELFARHGASVAFTDVDDGAGRETEQALRRWSPDSLYLHADMTDGAETEDACRETLNRLGRVDCLVNNAGAFRRAYLHETDTAEYALVMQSNFLSAARCTQQFLPGMMQARGGAIVNISSDYTLGSVPGVGAYAAAKGALNAYGRAVAMDYSRWGIRCNNLLTGLNMGDVGETYLREIANLKAEIFRHTQPIPRRGSPEDAAAVALFLASPMSQFMTGESIPVDGGITIQAHV